MTRITGRTLTRLAAALAAAGFAAGCSLQPRPTEELSQARLSVAQAVASAGAAAPDVKRAQDKVALSQRWMDARDYGPARWLAEQAEVDAELALARAANQDARRMLAEREQARAGPVRTSFLQRSILAEKAK